MTRKSDTFLINTSLIKIQDSVIKLQQDSIKNNTINLLSAYEQLNIKNDSLINKQEEINKTQNKANDLQHEIYNQVTGGNSIPLFYTEITIIRPSVDSIGEWLELKLFNIGKYPLGNISFSYSQTGTSKRPTVRPNGYKNKPPIASIVFEPPHEKIELPKLTLFGGKTRTIKVIKLDYNSFYLSNANWNVNITWRNIHYSANFKLTGHMGPENFNYWYIGEIKYWFNGKSYNKEKFIELIHKILILSN